MKFSLLSFKRVAALAAFGLLTGLPITTHAADQIWTPGNGIWDDVNPLNTPWSGAAWTNGNDAVFNAGTGTIAIGNFTGGSLNVGRLEFNGASQYTFDNDSLGSGSTINVTGLGIVQNNALTQTILSSATLNLQNSASAGTSNMVIQSTGIMNFQNSSTAGQAVITNGGNLTFSGSSLGGTATVDNQLGTVVLTGTSSTGGLTISNGGGIEAQSHTGPVSLGNVTNFSSGFAGSITTGSNTVNAGNLALNTNTAAGQNNLVFTLPTVFANPNGNIELSGNLSLTATPFPNPNFGNPGEPATVPGTVISIGGTSIAGGTYTLVDWTSAANFVGDAGALSNSNVNDYFKLFFQPGVNLNPATHLELGSDGSSLVLVAVPEPATVAMPLAACLGLLVLRRRATRMTVIEA